VTNGKNIYKEKRIHSILETMKMVCIYCTKPRF